MASSTTWQTQKENELARGVSVMTQIYVDRAKNAEIWDVEGNKYIDFAAGIAVLNTGHCNPKVVAAVQSQSERFAHICHQIFPCPEYVQLAERLNALAPGDAAKKTMFQTTGAEAVENAVKIARAATSRETVIAFSGAFHGRTFMGMALTGRVTPYKKGFGSLPGAVYHVPFPQEIHGISVDHSLDALDKLFMSDIDPSDVAAIIFEPVQGEGGFYQAPPELLKRLRQLCDDHGIVLIADEIQSGFARSGTMFCMEQYDVAPDLTCMAKSLGGGYPIAAVTGRADIMDAAPPGGLGGTYGGSPIGIAAAHAVLDYIESENLCQRANELGGKLKGMLKGLQERVPEILDVRGPGFMNAVEFSTSDKSAPSAEFANLVKAHAMTKGLVLLTCGPNGNIIRFLAPLTIEDETFESALQIIEDSILVAHESLKAK